MTGSNLQRPTQLGAVIGVFLLVLYFTWTHLPNLHKAHDTMKFKAKGTQKLRRSSKPNIIFLLADDLGYNDVGYHSSEIKTPNLDKLAQEGIKLENYYVQKVCSPSRGQLLSGKYQIYTGLQHSYILTASPNCLRTDIPTLPEKLREAGYATHIVGKWHLGYYKEECHPLNRGFDSFYGILTGKGDHYTHNNTAYIDGHILNGYDFWKNHDPDFSADGHYSTFLYQDRINQLIDDHDRSKPLFMYVPFQAVHSPLQVPDSYCVIYHNITELKRQRFAGMTTCMDEVVGNIVNKLKGSGLWRNTVLIFSTDNGGSVFRGGNNWPLRGWKNSMWEGAVRAVGFVLSDLLPTNVRGTTSKQLMDISDWFPTLVQGVAGHSIEGLDLDGYDMWDVLRSQVESPRLELVHNIDPWPNNPAKFSTEISAAIRVRDWKLITGDPGSEGGKWIAPRDYNITPDQPLDPKGKKIWLFNITADPCEKVDLSNHHPEIVESLLDKLKGYYQNSISPFHPPETIQADPQLRGGLWRAWA